MQTDQQLVQACLAGDIRAFAALVGRYRYPVCGICLGYTRNFDAAEDAAQEALIAAYLKLGDLPEPERFGPWLKRIAANQCRMWHRRQARQVPLDEEQAARLVAPGRSPEEELVTQQERQKVLAAIGRLSRPQQQAVVLFYLEGLSLRQIADFLEIPLQVVEQRLYRARLRLKQEMMSMVEKTLSESRLPADFAAEVVGKALTRGRQLLAERAWSSAKEEFGRIAAALPGHVESHRGLALALHGQVGERLREDPAALDEAQVQEAFAALATAWQLGADDEELLAARRRLYWDFGRNRDGGRFLEEVAGTRSDWQEQVRLLRAAIAVYYHSHYKQGEDNMEACVRCHRRILALAPGDLEPRRRLDLWRPGGVALAYPHLGLESEVFTQLDALLEAIAGEWSVYDHFSFTLAYQNQYRELQQWDQQVEEGHLVAPRCTRRRDAGTGQAPGRP